MDQYALLIFLYKIIITLSGLLIIFLGYKLFVKGVFNEAGDVEAIWNDRSVLIKKAAPGTFFVLFGAAIIAITTYKGLQFDNSTIKTPTPSNQAATDTRPILEDTLKMK